MKKLLKWLCIMAIFGLSIEGCTFEQVKDTATEITSDMISEVKQKTDKIKDSTQNEKADPTTEMQVSFVDVGQGDCTLIKAGDSALMVDTGMYYEYENVQEEMSNMGIYSLDYLVLTHPDADHIGSARDVIEDYGIGTVIMPVCESDTQTYQMLQDALDDEKVSVVNPKAGDTFAFADGSIDILAPQYDIADEYSNTNSFSIVCRVNGGGHSILLTGDATGEEIADAIDFEDMSADIIKLAHHGSAQDGCNSINFLSAVNPQYAIISCGYGNDYGHPHREVMDYLEQNAIKQYRTDLQGTIRCTINSSGITFEQENCTNFASGEELQMP